MRCGARKDGASLPPALTSVLPEGQGSGPTMPLLPEEHHEGIWVNG